MLVLNICGKIRLEHPLFDEHFQMHCSKRHRAKFNVRRYWHSKCETFCTHSTQKLSALFSLCYVCFVQVTLRIHASSELVWLSPVIPSFSTGAGAGLFGSLGVSWNTALPQQLSSSIDTAPQVPSTEDVATPTGSTHNEDDLGKFCLMCSKLVLGCS